MMMSKKIGWLAIWWMLAGVCITVYDHLVLHAGISRGVASSYSFYISLMLNIAIGFLAAITGGFFLVVFVNEKYRSVAYWKSILLVVISFLIVSLTLIVAVSILQAVVIGDVNRSVLKTFLGDSLHLKNLVIWSIVVAGTQFMLQIRDKFGPGVLYNLMIGRYHQPKEETRIFMIIDISSSTTIAEVLPQHQYHRLLRDFFADITKPILMHQGEIYQYVGDAIVISWKVKQQGMDVSCLRCYFDIQLVIAKLSSMYTERYGFVPKFKAGLHYGKVVAGEIGIIKKDITYSGDVLNTVSRIQGKCNEFRVSILTSDELLLQIPYENSFRRIPMGEIELRGKQQRVSVSTLELNDLY